MPNTLRIGELAKRCSVDPRTIRYYERIDLLPATARAANGYRQYDESDAERLSFIRRAKSLGLRLDEIRELMPLADSRDCKTLAAAVRRRVDERIAWIDRQIESLQSMREALVEFRQRQAAPPRANGADARCRCIDSPPDEGR